MISLALHCTTSIRLPSFLTILHVPESGLHSFTRHCFVSNGLFLPRFSRLGKMWTLFPGFIRNYYVDLLPIMY